MRDYYPLSLETDIYNLRKELQDFEERCVV